MDLSVYNRVAMDVPKVAKWDEPPAMDSGAPMPAVYSDATGLTCAYVTGPTHSQSGSTAILRFEGVLYYAMGYPNDEPHSMQTGCDFTVST